MSLAGTIRGVVLTMAPSDEPPDEPPEPPAEVAPPAAAAAPVEAGVAGELSAADAQPTVLVPMNDICGDTYCEGEYEWKFTALSCTKGKCKLGFTATHHETKKKFTETVAFDFAKPVFYPGSDGIPSDEFNLALDKAIRDWERKGKK